MYEMCIYHLYTVYVYLSVKRNPAGQRIVSIGPHIRVRSGGVQSAIAATAASTNNNNS